MLHAGWIYDAHVHNTTHNTNTNTNANTQPQPKPKQPQSQPQDPGPTAAYYILKTHKQHSATTESCVFLASMYMYMYAHVCGMSACMSHVNLVHGHARGVEGTGTCI